MVGYDKIVPPEDVLTAELDERVNGKIRAATTERILRDAGFESQVAAAVATIEKPSLPILRSFANRVADAADLTGRATPRLPIVALGCKLWSTKALPQAVIEVGDRARPEGISG